MKDRVRRSLYAVRILARQPTADSPRKLQTPGKPNRDGHASRPSYPEVWHFCGTGCNAGENSHPILMSNTYVPMISSGTAGPLGVLHLPRLWLKVSLEEAGKIAPGYPGIGRGYDAMTCAALGLDEQAVKDYIKQNKPTYPQFEAWVRKNAKSLKRDAIEKHNAAVRGYIHDDETRKNILGNCGITDDGSAFKDAVNLNNLDDWYEFHQAVLK